MKQPGFQASEPQPLETSRTRRARGYHRLGRLLLVALLLLLALIGCLAFLAGVGTMMLTGLREWHWLALAGTGWPGRLCRVASRGLCAGCCAELPALPWHSDE